MATIKSNGSFQGSEDELHLKAREVIIQRSVDSAIKAAQEKGTYTYICTWTELRQKNRVLAMLQLHVHVYVYICVHTHVYVYYHVGVA